MSFKWKDIISLITGRFVMSGWVDVINKAGERMIAKNFNMLDNNVKCVGVCSSYAIIFSGPYDESLEFMNKPQHYIIVIDKESLRDHMYDVNINEVLEAFRRICLFEKNQ